MIRRGGSMFRNRTNDRSILKRKATEEILEEIRKTASKPKPLFVGYAQIGGETLKKVIYE